MVYSSSWQQAQRILEVLSSLNYRTGELENYLKNIASEVSQLLVLDWSVITLCRDGQERVMASSLDMGEGEHIYSLHGTLTETVVKTGQTLAIENAQTCQDHGEPPEGYVSYLGIPLRTAQGEVIGTICSFCRQPRRFISEEVRAVELFAERAATAIDNYLLYQQEKRFHEMLEIEVAKRTEELRIAQIELIEQERLAAIGQFAAMIVHEIRNPITTILMGLTYCQIHANSEREKMRASLALDEAQRLQNLLSEILMFAKPQVLQAEEIEINAFVQEILINLQEIPEAEQKQIQYTPARESLKIIGDKNKLKQVLINLMRNACEAIQPREVVTCQVEKINHQGVCLKVHNYGTPIPDEILPKLTQPFCSNKLGGTGLGLAIVKRIVDAHHGSLSIESDTVSGTTVKVILPLREFSGMTQE